MAPGLCENCHKRPKFGTHKFCGKTCAAQGTAPRARATQPQSQAKAGPQIASRQRGPPIQQKSAQLCIHCGQKPKSNGFDYCGKSCAALAVAAQTKPPATQRAPATKQKTTHASTVPANNPHPPPLAKPHKIPRTKVPVPQADAPDDDELEEDEDGYVSTDLDAYPSDSESESENEPSAQTIPASSTKSAPKIASGICAFPGCGKQSHVDRNGVKAAYCSVKHREEAVKLGLEAACIMCQRYPQSTSDYFCSSACRNQSMTKT